MQRVPRADNPLFVPEAPFTPHIAADAFLTLAEFDGLGFSPFGIDWAFDGMKVSEQAWNSKTPTARSIRFWV